MAMARRSSPRCLGSGLLRQHLLFDELTFDVDLDVVADDELAVQHHVELHAEVLPVDLALGRVADTVTHVGVAELPVLDDVERHRLGGALDGEIACQLVAVLAGRLDLRALECDGRELVDLQEVGRSQVVVPGLVVRPDARGVDARLELRLFGVLHVDLTCRRDLGKVTSNGHHAQVLGRELTLSVVRVELPGTHELPPVQPRAAKASLGPATGCASNLFLGYGLLTWIRPRRTAAITAWSLEWTSSFSITCRTCHSIVWPATPNRFDISIVSNPSPISFKTSSSLGVNMDVRRFRS